MTVRVLLADDHALLRGAIRLALQSDPGLDVIAEAGCGSAVAALVALHQPDVVCMDVSMPDMDGISATKLLQTLHPQVKVIGLSAHADEQQVRAMMQAGACGYVLKMHAGSELVPAIRAVMQGLIYTSAELDD